MGAKGRSMSRARFVMIAVALIALASTSCKEENPPGKELMQDLSARRAAESKAPGTTQVASVPAAAPRAKAPGAAPAPQGVGAPAPEALAEEGTKTNAVVYDSSGRDPFRSFMRLEADRMSDILERSPLEDFDLGQLSLSAVVLTDVGTRALLTDPAGVTYIVGEGAKVGKNRGRVIKIADNEIVINEIIVDFNGVESPQDFTMNIRPPDEELGAKSGQSSKGGI